jgi:hypothetical protein
MFRIDDPSAAAALPAPEAAGTEGYFTEGNPGVTAASLVRASFLNMIQEELRAIVVAAAITPSKTVYNQVLSALQALFVGMTGNQTIAGTKTFSSPPKALNIAKVWARCNGAAATITSSHNVSSLTRTSAGVYVLNYASSMADSLYSACITAAGVSGVSNYMAIGGPVQVGIGMSTAGLQFGTCYITNTSGNATAIDADNISVQIFGN